jgi:hypothetical protein
MSSLYSDPPFGRGQTFLAGATATKDASGNYIEGAGVVGDIKVFQDIDPTSLTWNSNRLVHCLAVRVAQTSKVAGEQATDIVAGTVVKLKSGAVPEIDSSGAASGKAAAADAAYLGYQYGVVDEYLKSAPNVGDIIWLVVKGPTTVVVGTGGFSANNTVAVTTAGGAGTMAAVSQTTSTNVSGSLGATYTQTSLAIAIPNRIDGLALAAGTATQKARVILTNPQF